MIEKIDPQLINIVKTASKNEDQYIECIVYANNYISTLNKLNKICEKHGVQQYPFILAFGVVANENILHKIAELTEVSFITSNLKVKTCIDVSKKVLNVKSVKSNTKLSANFTVAVIDTGLSQVLDLSVPVNRLVHFEDFVNGKTGAYDDNGHGTFVTSVLAGNGLVSGKKYEGIDKNAGIIALKALDANGETGAMTILKAMQWVHDNKTKYNIKVVCMSFGSTTLGKKDPLIVGAEVLWNAGIVVVCAAGNSGPDGSTIRSPGASSKIITVGALDDNREFNKTLDLLKFEVADFSSRGPAIGNYKPDLLAPGVDIVSACNFKLTKHHYEKMNGTSVSTPMVAGVCSLMMRKNLNLTPNEVKMELLKNCIPICNDKNAEGFGLLNCNFLNKN